ncbi:regulatory protein GntR HTH [Parasphaerochaeta coccoides DSM 17374]|uniref:Regulatory protein GntR HTH n=2 Tax=Parasphaerochaeta TaxID=3062336 RepID=F4GJ20_PARC1|nr:regulatory protein GntR HTH [Parasphaerochaeta coccoides DSM 17374]
MLSLVTETKSSQIASKLEDMILNNTYKAGEKLPSQQELAKQFSTSSRSIREAFKGLEAKGLVQISQGRNAIVKSNNLDQFVGSLSATLFSSHCHDRKMTLDLIKARTVIEIASTYELSRNPQRMLIVRTLERFVTKMEQLIPRLEDHKDTEAVQLFRQTDINFHKTLFHSVDNIIFNSFYENFSPLLHSHLEKLEESFTEKKKKVNEYRYLIEALDDGQTNLAVALILTRMTNLRRMFENMFVSDLELARPVNL